eukprot:GHVS01052457.1.p1 GENE.GHVS01052457.1~~GHVS01052457.1.p1  ORF type:complete len:354 (-),score=34.72 GHVS01052457.1:36-1097(-)
MLYLPSLCSYLFLAFFVPNSCHYYYWHFFVTAIRTPSFSTSASSSAVPKTSTKVREAGQVPECVRSIIIHRHGMRQILRKGVLGMEEQKGKDGADVTILGQRQLEELGKAFRQIYSEEKGKSSVEGGKTFGEGGDNTKEFLPPLYQGFKSGVYSQSTWMTRAVRSGMAFMEGLFPRNPKAFTERVGPTKQQVSYDTQNVPMRMVAEDRDVWLRGWVGCAGFKFQLEQLYQSKEWKEKGEQTKELRLELHDLLLKGRIATDSGVSSELGRGGSRVDSSLEHIFNTVDELIAIRVSSHYAVISKERLEEGMKVVDWVERRRFGGEGMRDGGGMMAQRIWHSISYAVHGLMVGESH